MPHGIDPPNARRRFARLWEGQKGRCAYCGFPMAGKEVGPHDDARATFDHVKPKCAGGTWTYGNLVLAHRRCNRERGNGPSLPFAIDLAPIGGRKPWRGHA